MAAPPIYNPMIPCVHPIPGGLFPGRMLRVQGSVPPGAQRFAINLQCGPNTDPRDDIALHLNFRFVEQCVVRNHLTAVNWGVEDTSGGMPLRQGDQFEALVLTEPNCFKIALNGSHFCEFPHRVPYQRISHITVDGDVMVQLVGFEGAQAPSVPPQSYMPEQQAFGAYGAPPQPPAYGAPGYGAPQGYVGGPPDPPPPPAPPVTADSPHPRPDQPPDRDVPDVNLDSSHHKPDLDRKCFKTKEVESCSKHCASVHDVDRLRSQKKLSKSGHSLIPSKSTVAVLKSPSQDRDKEAVSNASSLVYSNSEFSIPSTLKVGLDQYSFLDKYSYSYLNAYEPPQDRPPQDRKPRVQIVINSETELIKESNLDLHENKSSATLLPHHIDSRVIKTEDLDLESHKENEFDIAHESADNTKDFILQIKSDLKGNDKEFDNQAQTNTNRSEVTKNVNELINEAEKSDKIEKGKYEATETVNVQETVRENVSSHSGCQPSSIMLYSQPSGGVQPTLQTAAGSQLIAVPETEHMVSPLPPPPLAIHHNQTGLLLHSPVLDINLPDTAQALVTRTSPLKFNHIRQIEQPRREPSHHVRQEDSTQKQDDNSRKPEDNSHNNENSGKQASHEHKDDNHGGSKRQDSITKTTQTDGSPQKENTAHNDKNTTKDGSDDASKQQQNSDKGKDRKEIEQEGDSQVPQITVKSQSHSQLPAKSALKRDSVSIPRGGVHIKDDSTTSTVSAHTRQPSGILKTPVKDPASTPASGSHDPALANKGSVSTDINSHLQDSKINISQPLKTVEHPTMLKDLIEPIVRAESESVHKLKRAETINAFDARQLQMNSALKLDKCDRDVVEPHQGHQRTEDSTAAHRKDKQTGCCIVV